MSVDKKIINKFKQLSKKLIIKNNFFDDPKSILKLFNKCSFYSSCDKSLSGLHLSINSDNKPLGNWKGYRSSNLSQMPIGIDINEKLKKVMLELDETFNISNLVSYLHIAPEFIVIDDSAWHIDISYRFAGVVYLNENPPADSGTILREDEKVVNVENVFNRLVLYDSSILHRPAKTFGNNLENSRKTLTFFIR
jgi:hypothetical protein